MVEAPIYLGLNLDHQLVMLCPHGRLKGVAAVPRASLVLFLSTLNGFLPAGHGSIGVVMIFDVDELMNMGRTCLSLVGDCLATIVVARWEGEFDDKRAAVFGTTEEMELDLREGELVFGEAARND